MKTKTLTLIASGMIFGAALLTGIAVIVILMMSNNNTPATSPLIQEPDSSTEIDKVDFVYLFDSQNFNLLQVSTTNASQQEFSLGLPGDDSVYVYSLSFSDDGRYIAFCTNERQSLEEGYVEHRLIVRDIEAGQNLLEIPFGRIAACEVSAFNESGTEVAIGMVFNSIIEGRVNFPDDPNWALRTYDIATGTITHDLNADSDNAPDYESMRTDFWFEEGISAMTRALYFDDNQILLNAYPYIGRDGPLRTPAHHWDLNNGTVTPVDGLTYLGADYLPETGEIVYPYLDENFAYASPPGPMPRANTLQINDNGEIRTIYRTDEAVIANATFINGGTQIAAMLIPGFDHNDPGAIMGDPRYQIINRDGSNGQVSSNFFSYNQLHGTGDGFIMLSVSHLGAEGNEYNLVHYANNQNRVLWSNRVLPGQSYQFAWSPDMILAGDLAPFATID